MPIIIRHARAASDLIKAVLFTLKALLVRALLQLHPLTLSARQRAIYQLFGSILF
jgi:hypothetical protein